MISVVIPLYNKEKQIATTLQSVFNQTYQDFEIVIVNDGSTDGSVKVVESIKDSRIRLLHQKNAGVSAARNKGIEEAKGEYIALLDADDEWKPDYLETQYNLIKNYPECEVFATNYEFKNKEGKIIETQISKILFKEEHGILNNYFEVASCSHPPLWTSAIVVKKYAIQKVNGFPVGIKSGEDLLTWAKLACQYKIAYTTKVKAAFIFDESIFNEDQKARSVSMNDEVGIGLKSLAEKFDFPGLKDYVALWYKMRTRIYLSKAKNRLAFTECIESMKYNFNLKIIIFIVMCFLPYRVNIKLFKKFS